jgi:hypothetical protein
MSFGVILMSYTPGNTLVARHQVEPRPESHETRQCLPGLRYIAMVGSRPGRSSG